MKKKIIAAILSGILVFQSGIFALAEELILCEEIIEDVGSDVELQQDSEVEIIETEVEIIETEVEEIIIEGESATGNVNLLPDETTEIILEDILEEAPMLELGYGITSGEGDCGKEGANVKWKLVNGVLTISGTGEMADYNNSTGGRAPYNNDTSYYNDNITSVVVEEGVTAIGNYAFAHLLNLASVKLPSSLTKIGNNAFDATFALQSISLPNGLTTIGENAFSSSRLTSIVIPNSVTSIGSTAFYCCDKMTTVSLPKNLTEISYCLFIGCSGLTNIDIPSTVKSIESRAFEGCSGLTSLTIPAGVESMGSLVFDSCDALETLYFLGDMPAITGTPLLDGVTKAVTIYYLSGAKGWNPEDTSVLGTNVTLRSYGSGTTGNISWSLNSNGVLTISGTGAMADYEIYGGAGKDTPWYDFRNEIKEVIISAEVTSVGNTAFAGCENLKKVTIADGVTKLGDAAFCSCYLLEEVSISDTVTSIGNDCFYDCNKLKSITLPSSLRTIGEFAFCDCDLLESIVIPKSVKTIGIEAFELCKNLREAVIEENSVLESIGDYAFNETNLRTFEMPDSVTSIGMYAFALNHELEKVVLSQNITEINGCMFISCAALKEIEIPAKVTRIRLGAFEDTGLTSIEIPAGVTEIGGAVFEGCSDLKEIYFYGDQPTVLTGNVEKTFAGVDATVYYPLNAAGWTGFAPANWGGTLDMVSYGEVSGTCGENVKWVLDSEGNLEISGTGPMTDFTDDAPWFDYEERASVKKVIIQNGVTSIGNDAFCACPNLKEVTIADSVTSIGTYAFFECVDIEQIVLPEVLTNIGEAAFRNTHLTSITIPASVTNIGKAAFKSGKLNQIVFKGSRPTVGTYALSVNSDTLTITYPEGDETWTDVKSIDDLGGLDSVDILSADMVGFNKHIHSWKLESDSAACASAGTRFYRCYSCNETYSEVSPSLGHKWNSGSVTKAATCAEKGVKTYTCLRCGGTYTESTAAKGHSAGSWITTKNPTCTSKGTKVQKCKTCGDTLYTQSITAKGHSFGGWTTVSEATVFANKKEQKKCTVCNTVEKRDIEDTKLTPTIKLNAFEIPLKKGQSTTKIKVSDLQNGDYVKSWTSDKPKTVSVTNSGKITAKKVGKATLTVTLASGKQETLKVIVQKKAVKTEFIKIVGYTEFTVKRGTKLDLMATAKPEVYPITSTQKLTFSSSNKSVATVSSSGVITAKKGGTVKITMKSGSAKKWTFTVTVPKITTKSITGIPEKLTMKKGKSYKLKTTLNPKNSEEKVTYKSSKKSVVSVDSKGKLKAKKKGKAVITIKSGGATVKCNVTVS